MNTFSYIFFCLEKVTKNCYLLEFRRVRFVISRKC